MERASKNTVERTLWPESRSPMSSWEQVPLVGDAYQPPVPEMVVRIAEGDLRFKRRLLGQGQPIVVSKWHVIPPIPDRG